MTPYRDPNDLALGGFVDPTTFRFVREYPHPRERVWAALTEAEQLGVWLWPCSAFEARPGGRAVFDPGKPLVLQVTAFEPPRRLSFSDRICFSLELSQGGCRLTLDLKRPDDGWSPMALAGFHGWLGRLARLLAQRPQAETEAWASGIWNAVIAHCEWEVSRHVAGGERVLWRLHFGEGDAALDLEATAQLDTLAHLLVERNMGVTLDGFGDDSCEYETSLSLCRARLDAVRACLEARGLPADRIHTGFVLGNYHYMVERDDAAGRAYNRRIELRPTW
jgi:outer membrane protein OmpA-like peptidoglycan-associated protein